MKNRFYSYIDGFDRITIIVPHKYRTSIVKRFVISSGLDKDEVIINSVENLGNEKKYNCSITEGIDLTKDYVIFDEQGERSNLRIGSISRSQMFEMIYFYDENDLGVRYFPDHTEFRIWTPVAKEVELELIDLKGGESFHDLEYQGRGVWYLALNGDYDSYKYRYRVRVNDLFETTLDPYAVSSDANANYNYIIDPGKLYQFTALKPHFSGKKTDAIVYEMHIRDFSIDPSSGAKQRGNYLSLIENSQTVNGNKTGLDYIQSLGVTHIQLMPIFDFGGVDELCKDKDYNWGYNPVQFNVPEGWFSSKPNDPYCRINELRKLIDEAHRKGLRVVMDVVFNHVYDMRTFPFDILVPGYGYRFDRKGIRTEVSGCKNDLASERKMVRKFIRDSVKFWMKNYNIDGFRFDLMGLLDIETMNSIQGIVKAYDEAGIVYGEGWDMPNTLDPELRSHMHNQHKMPDISHFNDKFRNVIKGSPWGNLGYALGGDNTFNDVQYLLTGSCIDGFMFNGPAQSVNYVECHDYYTLMDTINLRLKDCSIEEKKYYHRLATQIVLISEGMPFLHAGQEFFRDKKGVENSYNSPDSINSIKWDLMDDNLDSVNMVRDLISIRKDFKEFRLSSTYSIKERLQFLDYRIHNVVGYTINGLNRKVLVIVKNNFEENYINIGEEWNYIFDGMKRINIPASGFQVFKKPGVYIFVK